MKKRFILLVLSLIILVLFSCDLTIPTAIEVKGNPTVRFVENINIGDMFKGILDDAVNGNGMEGINIQSCENTDDFTFLIYMNLFEENFSSAIDLPGSQLGGLGSGSITITGGDKTILETDTPVKLPLSSIGSRLPGFKFKGFKTKLYFNGTNIISKANIEMKIDTKENGATTATKTIYIYNPITREECNIEEWKNATAPLTSGVDIDLPIDGKDIEVSFKVYLTNGTEIQSSDLDNGHIKVEVVVWLPFELTATTEANIALPLFDSSDDLFGRESPGASSTITDIIESLKLEIKFDKNPFQDTKLIVSSKGIYIENPFDDTSFIFELSEEDMTKINSPENWPFTPEFKLHFDNGSTLKLPREFNITELIFTAKINYKIDLSEED